MSYTYTPTQCNQESLPPLPVPTLQETAAKYLKSLEPVLSPEELESSKRIVAQFIAPGGEGERLQQKLLHKASETKNWLEKWWETYAYLYWPDPIPINSNFNVFFEPGFHGVAHQSRQAARLLIGNLLFRKMVINQQFPAHYLGGKIPLDMFQMTKLSTTIRIPGLEMDSLHTLAPGAHCIVISRKHFYKVQLDGVTSQQLESYFDWILEDSAKRPSPKHTIGILTAGDRRRWGSTRQKMIDLHPVNAASFDALSTAIEIIALDEASPKDDSEAGLLALAGDADNRFFDKIMQNIVFRNGYSGGNGEHSPYDAPSGGYMMDFSLNRIRDLKPDDRDPFDGIALPNLNAEPPVYLEWKLNEEIEKSMEEAAEDWKTFSSDIQLRFFNYDRFGSSLLKKMKVSPDSFVQMSIQLAYYKLYQTNVPTYETAATRRFYHGRTETGRTLTNETVVFTKTMTDPAASAEEKVKALQNAIKAHLMFMADASVGKGCDRHLLGLRILAMEEGGDMPEIFTDPAFRSSTTYKLSTSNISPNTNFHGGFGPLVPEGYGICYTIRPDFIRLQVTCKPISCPENSTEKMSVAVIEAMDDIAGVFAAVAAQSKSKL